MSTGAGDQHPAPGVYSPRLVLRPDLVFQRWQAGNGPDWVVGDALGGEHFALTDDEYRLLQLCRDPVTPDDLRQRFREARPGVTVSPQELAACLATAVERGLLVRRHPGGSLPPVPAWREPLARVLNPLAIRLPGVDPGRGLRWLGSRVGWLFSPAGAWGCGLVCLLAGVVALARADQLRAELPRWTDWLTPGHALVLWLTLAATKLIHELGHALICQHHGGRCRELGVLLLFGAPTLYCDVSAAWMFPGRRARLLVSAGGMLAELLLASLAVLLWAVTAPGPFHSGLLAVMVVCSVSTLVVNANPLLGYDGYFLLSDAVGIPNLATRASGWWRQRLQAVLLDLPAVPDPLTPWERWFLPVYGVASGAFRLGVLVLLVAAARGALAERRLAAVGDLLTLLACAGWCLWPLRWAGRIAGDAGLRPWIAWRRVGLATAVWGAGLAGLWIPLPTSVVVPGQVEPATADPVFVSTAGRLVEAVAPGRDVAAGDLLARLENGQLSRRLAELDAARDATATRLEGVTMDRGRQPGLAAAIPQLTESLRGWERQQELVRDEVQSLEIRAPRAGRVCSPPAIPEGTPGREDDAPGGWVGSPLDPENRGCLLERGTLLCSIAGPGHELRLLVPEPLLGQLAVGQGVQFRTAAGLGTPTTGTIAGIGARPVEGLPGELAATGSIPTRPEGRWLAAVPLEPHYEVRVRVEREGPGLTAGQTGRARVWVEWTPLWRRHDRWFRRVFRPRLPV
ncbi:MAG: hypothetical protein ACKO3P_24695 [Planctomycetaceae bacterium]